MTSPIKFSYFNHPPPPARPPSLSRYVLNVSPPSNRTSLIATKSPLNRKDFLFT